MSNYSVYFVYNFGEKDDYYSYKNSQVGLRRPRIRSCHLVYTVINVCDVMCCKDIWHLLRSQVKKHDVVYDLEPDVKYSQIEFVLFLERKPLHYIVNIVVPCCLLVIISLLVSSMLDILSLSPDRFHCLH